MFREWLEQNRTIATIGAVVIFVLVIVYVALRMFGGGGAQIQAFYYDLNTKELKVDAPNLIPPIEAGTGSEPVVAALVYACGDGCGTDAQKIGLLWRYTPKGIEIAEELATLDPMNVDNLNRIGELEQAAELEREYRAEDGDKWLAADDPGTDRLISKFRNDCPGSSPMQICSPQ